MSDIVNNSKVVNVVGREKFISEVMESQSPVLVDFWAPWCPPCRMMIPVLDEMSEELAGKLKIVKIDTMEELNQELAIEYQIQSIPNMKLFKNGKVVGDYVGYKPKDVFVEELNKIL